MQDVPISKMGGSRSTIGGVSYTWKDNQLVAKIGKKFCKSNGHPSASGYYAPGFFSFRGNTFNNNSSIAWRSISSANKHYILYGKASTPDTDPTIADIFTTSKFTNNPAKNIDDTLPYPATFGLIPLIKI